MADPYFPLNEFGTHYVEYELRGGNSVASLAGKKIPDTQKFHRGVNQISKMHEEVLRGNLEDFANQDRNWKGEITLVIAGSKERKTKNNSR